MSESSQGMRLVASQLMVQLEREVKFFDIIFDNKKTETFFRIPDEVGKIETFKYDDDGTISTFLKNKADEHLQPGQILDYIRVRYNKENEDACTAKIYFTVGDARESLEFKY